MRLAGPRNTTLKLATVWLQLATVWLLCLATAWAQNPASDPLTEATPPPTKPALPVHGPAARAASELDTYLLRDSKGNLVPVIGMSFEDFEALIQLKKGLAPPPPPPFAIDSLTITGRAEATSAELQAAVQIRVRQSGWVRVPLRLGGTALLEPAKYQGPGEHVLSVAENGEGYWLWLKGEGKPHQVQLRLAAPIVEAAQERRLLLNLPRGTESAVRLQVPLSPVAAQLRNGSEGILSSKSLSGNQSEISVVGPTGDLQLSWQPGRAPTPESRPTLVAAGDIQVRIESRSRISAEARLKLRSIGKPIETVSIRLPPGMQLVPAPTVGYTVTLQEAEGTKPNAPRVVDLRFDRPTTGPVEVRLLAEQEVAGAAADAALRPGRFEVIGAQQQRGSIDFLVEGDWNLSWSDESSTRRVDLTEATLTAGRPVARFDYYKQPLDLKVSVTARPTRVAVEPQYQVFVDATRLRMEATFRFRIRGPKATSTNLELGGWRVDNITAENSVEQPLPPTAGVTTLTLPLAQMDTTKGELTYRIEAHQDLPADQESVKFSLPRPPVDITAPAAISVQAADNVELTPSATELKGLIVDSGPAVSQPSSRQQAQLHYRDLGAAEAISFVGTRRIRTRYASARGSAIVNLQRSSIEIKQKLQYQISYEGKRSFLLALPPGTAEPTGLQVLLDQQLLEHRPAENQPAGQLLLEVFDTQPRLGAVELTLLYSLPALTLKADGNTSVSLPLITAAEGEFDRWLDQAVRIEYPEDLRLQLPKATALVNELSGRGVLEGKTEQQLNLLDLEVAPLQMPEIRGLVIDRMWIQSWLAPQERRQERCVLQVRTAVPTMTVRLPESLTKNNVRLLVDGRSVPVSAAGERSVKIDFGEADPTAMQTPQTHVVELWYSAPRAVSHWWFAEQTLTPPHVEGAEAPQRIQWQVVLPSQEHLLFDPPDYAPEMRWTWRDYFWSRTALYDQRFLEDLCGASRQDPFPASLNNYLYSSVGSEPVLHLSTIGQRPLAMWLAGTGLLCGLLLLHVPQVRSATGLLILAAILLALGFAAPQAMLFAAQIVGLGLVVVAVSAGLRWLWTGQVPAAPPVVARSPSHLSGARSTGSRSHPPPVTTAAASALPSQSVPGNKSASGSKPAPQEVES